MGSYGVKNCLLVESILGDLSSHICRKDNPSYETL